MICLLQAYQHYEVYLYHAWRTPSSGVVSGDQGVSVSAECDADALRQQVMLRANIANKPTNPRTDKSVCVGPDMQELLLTGLAI
jgi:hypothetical protein